MNLIFFFYSVPEACKKHSGAIESIRVRNVVLVGLAVREAFSFWTGHPFDFELWVRTGYWTFRGLSPYGILPAAPGLSFSNIYSQQSTATIGYLPLWPVITGAMYLIYATIGINNPFLYYFLLKQPIILGDILLGYAIYIYVKKRNPSKAEWALAFWCFSPLAIIVSGIWGTFDGLAMLFVVLALLSSRATGKSFWSGVATLVKSIPVIYSLPLALSGKKKARNLAIAIATPFVTSLVIVLELGWSIPVALTTLESTLPKGGESLSLWDAFFYLSKVGGVPSSPIPTAYVGYLWIPATLILSYVAYKKFGFGTDYGLFQSLLLCTLGFLIFRAQVNEQYSTYLLALASIDVAVWNRKRRWLLFGSLSMALLFLLVNDPLLIRFVAPSYPGVIQLEASVIAGVDFERFTAKLVLSTLFSAINIVYLVLVLRAKRAA